MQRLLIYVLLAPLLACSGRAGPVGGPAEPDSGSGPDAGPVDSGVLPAPDAGRGDAGAPDAGAVDSGVPDSGPWPGGYVRGPVNFDIQSPADARRTSIEYGGHETWVSVFTEVVGNHRTRVRSVRFNGGVPLIGGGLLLDDPVAVTSLEPTVTRGADGQGPLLLVAWEDAREGAGIGHREIYSQLLRTNPAGEIVLVGGNFNVSQRPVLEEYHPCIGFDPAQGFLVAWSDTREVEVRTDGRVIFARFVSPAGSVGPELRLGDTSSWQSGCAAAGGGGRIAVAWWDYLPTGGNNVDIAYRARFLQGGAPGPLLTISREGNVIPDPPAVAYNSRRDEFLIVYMSGDSPREVHATLYRADGTARRTGLRVGVHVEGAAVPSVAYSARTDSYLVTYHAMTSNDAYAQELDANGERVGNVQSVNDTAPPLGTFYAPVAASASGDRFLVTPMHDFSQVGGTFFSAP